MCAVQRILNRLLGLCSLIVSRTISVSYSCYSLFPCCFLCCTALPFSLSLSLSSLVDLLLRPVALVVCVCRYFDWLGCRTAADLPPNLSDGRAGIDGTERE